MRRCRFSLHVAETAVAFLMLAAVGFTVRLGIEKE